MITEEEVKDKIFDGFLNYISEYGDDSSGAIFDTEKEANKEAEVWNSFFKKLYPKKEITVRAEVYSENIYEKSRNSKPKKITGKKYGWIIRF